MGKNSLGNIAIDDISVAPGVCPSKLFTLIVFSSLTGSLTKLSICLPILKNSNKSTGKEAGKTHLCVFSRIYIS